MGIFLYFSKRGDMAMMAKSINFKISMLMLLSIPHFNLTAEDSEQEMNQDSLELVKFNEMLKQTDGIKRDAFTKAVATKFGGCLPGPTGATGSKGTTGAPGTAGGALT